MLVINFEGEPELATSVIGFVYNCDLPQLNQP